MSRGLFSVGRKGGGGFGMVGGLGRWFGRRSRRIGRGERRRLWREGMSSSSGIGHVREGKDRYRFFSIGCSRDRRVDMSGKDGSDGSVPLR